MSALARFMEDEGLATVVVALVREHARKMRPPRALWVPYELGRPFGAPDAAGLQSRILRAALALLDDESADPILRDFDEDDPHPRGDPDWTPPDLGQAGDAQAEVALVRGAWEAATARLGRTTVGVSGLDPEAAVTFVERFHDPEPMPNPPGMAALNRVRFAVDDIKACYLEAATARAGHPSSAQLTDWFWDHTRAGAMIKAFQARIRASDDDNERTIAGRFAPAHRVLP